MITYNYKLDVTPGDVPPVIHVKQYQTDASLVFELYSSRGNFAPGTITDKSIRGTKADGNGYSSSTNVTYSFGTVTVKLDQQMTAVAGKQPYEITLTDTSGKMITATFILDVERAALDADTVVSESLIREVEDVVEEYLDEHPTLFIIDDTLSVSGRAADAKKTGDEIKKTNDTFNASHIRDNSILYKLPWGGYTQSGNETNGYYISTNTQTFGMSEIRYATKPIVIRQKNPSDTSVLPAVQKYSTSLGSNKYTPSLSLVGWFDADGKHCCTIMAGQYYWIGFRDGNNPYQLTVDSVADKFEIFETDAPYGYGGTHATSSQSGSFVAAMSISTQHAEEDLLVTCDDWAHFGVTYATYASDNPNEVLVTVQYASSRLRDFVIPQGTYYRLYIIKYSDSGQTIRPSDFNELLEFADNIKVIPKVVSDGVYKNDAIDVRGAKTLIALLANRIDALERVSGVNTVPTYYQSHIESKVSTINSLHPSSGDQFIFITDIHVGGYAGRGGNSMNSHSLINYICKNTQVNKVFNGGDIISNDSSYTIPRSVDRIRTAISYAQPDTTGNQFYIVGNHDGGLDYDGEGNTISTRHITADVLAVESGVYSVGDVVKYDPNSPFQFYFDNNGIRYIVLDIGERDTATDEGWVNSFRFFADALISTPLDHTVVVFNHQSGYSRESSSISDVYYQYIYDVVDAYNDKTSYDLTSSVSKDFSNSLGECCCVICGHHHEDFDFETTDGVPIILTTTDNGGARKLNNSYIGDSSGTVNEQAFDVFSIDTENRTIKATRVGYGSDRTFSY